MENLEKLSLVDLRLMAKKMEMKGVTGYRKQELVDLLTGELKKREEKENAVKEKRQTNYAGRHRENEKNTSYEKEDMNNKRNAYNKKAMQRHNEKQQRNMPTEMEQLDSGEVRSGILEVMSEGYGFIRCDNYLPGEEDVYVSPALIRKYHLRTGDILEGNIRVRNQNEKFGALLYIKKVNWTRYLAARNLSS